MKLSTEDLMSLMARAAELNMEVTITPAGKVTMRPVLEAKPKPLSAAEKQKSYRQRLKSVTETSTLESETVTKVTENESKSPSLSPTPPIPTRTHTPAYTCDPCTLEEAQNYAQQNGVYINPAGVEKWFTARSAAGWLVHHNNGTATPIPDWKKDLRNAPAWVRSSQAQEQTVELRLKREQSYANTASKPKQSTFFP